MEKNKKFSKANLLYVFSMLLGLTIIAIGFSVANNAKKELEQRTEIQNQQVQVQQNTEAKPTSKPAENVVKSQPAEEVVLVQAEEEKTEEDEFAPKLENYVLTKPADGEITVSFTGGSLVYSEYFDDWSVHKGVDIAAQESAQVKAVANGRVKSVYSDNRKGNVIILEHGDFITVYGNLSTTDMVAVGDEVYAGDIISGVGKSPDGKTFLHFELSYKGEDIDPEPLFY